MIKVWKTNIVYHFDRLKCHSAKPSLCAFLIQEFKILNLCKICSFRINFVISIKIRVQKNLSNRQLNFEQLYSHWQLISGNLSYLLYMGVKIFSHTGIQTNLLLCLIGVTICLIWECLKRFYSIIALKRMLSKNLHSFINFRCFIYYNIIYCTKSMLGATKNVKVLTEYILHCDSIVLIQ